MSPAVLKPAGPDDVEALLEFVGEYYAFDGIPFEPGRVREGLRQLIADDNLGRAWLIRHRGENVGHLVLTYGFDLEFGGRVATVTEVYLRPDHRGKGLGAAAFAEVERFCSGRGILALELQAEEDNAEARRFYQRLGFAAHPRVPFSKRLSPQT